MSGNDTRDTSSEQLGQKVSASLIERGGGGRVEVGGEWRGGGGECEGQGGGGSITFCSSGLSAPGCSP